MDYASSIEASQHMASSVVKEEAETSPKGTPQEEQPAAPAKSALAKKVVLVLT